MALLYTDYDKTPYRTRLMAHVKAMEALAQRYPQDDEAQIAYAILLNVSAPLGDKTYAQQLKGAAILEPISQRLPQHPGVTHYLIHLYDYPPLAQKGLDAANRYAKIAPAAPHAQHMPSHIYTRVGYWKELIAANIGSVKAARAHNEDVAGAARPGLHGLRPPPARPGRPGARRHRRDAWRSQEARSRRVRRPTSRWRPARRAMRSNAATGPARWRCRSGRRRFPYVDAITHFARALGAARAGQPAAAKADIAKLAELRDTLRKANDAYWAEQVDIQRQVASRLGAVCRRQARRGAAGDERGRRRRGQDREARR